MAEAWDAIRLEYIAGELSYKALSEKHSVSYYALQKAGQRGGWVKERTAHRKEVAECARREIAAEQTKAAVQKLSCLQRAADKLAVQIEAALGDELQFRRHLVRREEMDGTDKKKWIEEEVFKKFDTRAIRDMTAVVKDLATAIRSLYDLPTLREEKMMEVAERRLELEEKRSLRGFGDDLPSGVVYMPEVAEEGE